MSTSTTRGWRFFAAQVIYWLGISLIGAISLGMVGFLVWSFLQMVDMVNLFAIGIIVGGVSVVIGFGALFGWAEKYLEKNK